MVVSIVASIVAAVSARLSEATPLLAASSTGTTEKASELVHMEGMLRYLPSALQEAIASSQGFTPAFLQSLLLILACEIGDRTFFVAAILAMKSSRVVVWSGALSALAGMTILSAGIGKAFPLLLDKKWTSIAASMLFLYFGILLLRDWWRMRHAPVTENEELCEVENELLNDSATHKTLLPSSSLSSSSSRTRDHSTTPKGAVMMLCSPVFAKAFSMTALAEWGDRSQIATIALAASRDLSGVIVGAVLGHAICTGLAVIGGRLLASSISERAVALTGGVLFISFALLSVSGSL